MFIDKFAFTFDVSPERRPQVLRNIGFNIIEDVDAILNGRKPERAKQDDLWFTDKRYAVTHRISVGLGREDNLVQDDPTNSFNLLIQLSPRDITCNFARVNVNPNKADWPLVVEHITSIFGESMTEILEKGRITLLETTFDIYGIPHEDLYLYGMRTGKTIALHDGGNNFYFGATGAHRVYVHYDKRKHIKYQNTKRPHIGREPIPSRSISRIEIRHKRANQGEAITFQSAFELHKYFRPISIFHIPKTANNFTIEEELRLDKAQDRGLIAATREMPRRQKENFIEKLAEHRFALFHSINYEQQLADTLNSLINY
jgi:hypothetical protein